jgi:hypothetical protein
MVMRRMEEAACALAGAGLIALVAMPLAAGEMAAPTAAATPSVAAPQAADGPAARVALEERLRQLKLPSLEGLTTGSDFSAFAALGVPEDIRRAAFKRSYELFEAEAARNPVEDYARF